MGGGIKCVTTPSFGVPENWRLPLIHGTGPFKLFGSCVSLCCGGVNIEQVSSVLQSGPHSSHLPSLCIRALCWPHLALQSVCWEDSLTLRLRWCSQCLGSVGRRNSTDMSTAQPCSFHSLLYLSPLLEGCSSGHPWNPRVLRLHNEQR